MSIKKIVYDMRVVHVVDLEVMESSIWQGGIQWQVE